MIRRTFDTECPAGCSSPFPSKNKEKTNKKKECFQVFGCLLVVFFSGRGGYCSLCHPLPSSLTHLSGWSAKTKEQRHHNFGLNQKKKKDPRASKCHKRCKRTCSRYVHKHKKVLNYLYIYLYVYLYINFALWNLY